MRKKGWMLLLSGLLLFQVASYVNSEREQRKEVKVPEAETIESVSSQPLSTQAHIEPTSPEANEVPQEEITFVSNPAAEYYQINPDYVGWLMVSGTIIDYPVVRGSDNETYLTHNFYREPDVLGAIFMDYRNIGMGKDRHTIIYGHYTQHGQMFRELEKFLYEDFLRENLEFTFKDTYAERRYRIFSVHVAPPDPGFLAIDFEGEAYGEFLASLQARSYFPIEGVEVTAEDRILTLVTCNFAMEDGRLFIHAVEVTE